MSCDIGDGSRSRMAPMTLACVFPRMPCGREHLVEHAAERKDVGARVGVLSFDLLGRHVLHRAEDRLLHRHRRLDGGCDRQAGRGHDCRRHLRQAEVEQLRARFRQHDVARLQIAVDDAGAVRLVERIGDLDRA